MLNIGTAYENKITIYLNAKKRRIDYLFLKLYNDVGKFSLILFMKRQIIYIYYISYILFVFSHVIIGYIYICIYKTYT